MYTSKFAKCSFVLALIVGGLFLFSEVSLAQPPAPQILLPRNLKIEEGAVIFKWTSTGAVEYAFLLDGEPNTDVVTNPKVVGAVEKMDVRGLEGITPQKRYDLGKGEYYFHVAAKNDGGLWSAITHFGPVKVISSSFLIDDFDDGGMRTYIPPPPAEPTPIRTNDVGGDTGTVDDEFNSSCTPTYPQNPDDVPAPPGSLPGYSLKLAYNLNYQELPTSAWAGYKTDLRFWNFGAGAMEYPDFSGYQALSFWVKGAAGGEKFYIKARDAWPEGSGPVPTPYTGDLAEIAIGDIAGEPPCPYLPLGVTTDWKRVIIPLYAFRPISGEIPGNPPTPWTHGPITWSKMSDLSITFEQRIDSGRTGSIYIDNIEFLAGYAPVDNFDAGRQLPPYPDPEDPTNPPYSFIMEDDATITVAYASGGEAYGENGKSLKLTYSVPAATGEEQPNSKFQYHFPAGQGAAKSPLDISHLSTLGFYVKGASGGEKFNVYLVDERAALPPHDLAGRKHVKGVQYVTVRNNEWHYVAIPLEDFKLRGIDLTKIYTLEIAFEWEVMSGTIYIDNIEFTNGLFKEPSTGPVRVEGRKLLVDGLPFTIRGAGYQPTPIGKIPYGTEVNSIDLYADTPTNRDIWKRDLSLLQAMGINTIRTWGKVTSTAFLDACLEHGIYVIMGFDIPSTDVEHFYFNTFGPGGPPPDPTIDDAIANRIYYIDDFAAYVETYKDHPAVLMWAISNEVNYRYGGDVWWDSDDPHYELSKEAYLNPEEVRGVNAAGVITGGKRLTMREFYTLVNELARTAYEVEGDKYHPTMCPNGDLLYIGEQHYYIPTDPYFPDQVVRVTDSAMNYLDMWGANVYRGNSFANNPYGIDTSLFNPSGLFKEYEARSAKPFVITEYGIDAYNNDTLGEYEATQASYAIGLWNEVMANSDSCVGASIMEYSDEWWKDDDVTASPSSHDTGGAVSPIGNPDKFSNEEWYGIMRPVDNGADPDIMEPRQAYNDLSNKLAKELLVDDFNAPLNPDPEYPYDHTPELVNRLGGEINVIERIAGAMEVILDYDESVRQGADGYSLKIQYNMNDTLPSWAGLWTRFGPVGNEPIDIRGFNTLSFWVKGAVGGEKFRVSLTPDGSEPDGLDHEQETKVSILDYLPQGVTTEWQEVSMPLSAFTKLEDRDKVEQFAIIFETGIGSADAGTIYIEDIKFERRGVTPQVWVDNFNDEIPTNALQGSIWTYKTGGAAISWDYDSAGYDDSRCIYTTYDVPDGSHAKLNMGLYGVDVSSQDTLTFYIKGRDSGERVHVYLEDGVLNPLTWEVIIINRGSVVISKTTNDWQKIRIPLSEFKRQGVDLTRLQILSFVFEWGAMAGKIYIDEIRFESVGDIPAPTLDPLPELVNYSPIELSGTKAPETGIFIDGAEAYPVDDNEEWSCDVSLTPGENTLRITARNRVGAQSEEILVYITYDDELELTTPPAAKVWIANDPTGGSRNDSTIHVAVSNYSVGNAQHTGYQVEICRSQTFSEAIAIYNYWHNSNTAAGAQFIDKYVNFDIDVNQFVGADKVWATLPSAVYVRVRAARFGFTPSSYDGTKYVSLSSNIFLEAPNSAELLNADEDYLIKVEITPRNPRTAGKVIETGYRIDFLPGNKSFATAGWDEMYHAYVNYDGVSTGALPYYIDMRDAVNSGVFTWEELEVYGVRARVASIKKGFTPSGTIFTSPDTAPVKNITRLQNPTDVTVWNPLITRDRTITVEVINYDPANLGIPTDSITGQNKMNVRHTGYRIDICKDQNFNEGETYSHYYNYDFEGDDEVDLIRAALPGLPGNEEGTTKISIDIDLLAAAPIFGEDFINSTFTNYVYVRLIAIRDGYAVNYDDKVDSYIGFRGTTRLQNPGAHATVYNSEPGNPPDKMDRTITVEVENYDPSGIANGMNLKDKRHAGYRVDLSSTSSFTEGQTYSHYYIYDPNEDGVADAINSTIKENVKIHIDLDVCRDLWVGAPPPGGPASNMVYVRVLAYSPGMTFNCEDTEMPSVPYNGIGLIDRTLLATPATSRAMNPTNSNAGNEVDSSMYITTAATTPGPITHDGYSYKFSVVSDDGKTYSKICPVTGIDPTSAYSKTLDIKELFEEDLEEDNTNPYNNYNLADLLGIPVDAKRGVAIEVVSTKEGYTDSAATILTPIIGTLQFKNTSVTFFHLRTVILGASNPVGTSNVAVQLERYVATPPAPPATGVYYEVQCSTDPTFPDDSEVTVTDRFPVSTTVDKIVTVNVGVLKAIADNSQDYVYVQARFIKNGYTPNAYTVHPSTVTIATLPPMIADFTATPAAAGAAPSPSEPFTVTFSATTLGTVSTYSWDLDGNGTPDSTAASPTYNYNTVGTYTVTLTVTGGGSSDVMTKVDYIKVGNRAVLPGGSIQTAVTSASNGQSIVVLDGTLDMPDYPGDITIAGKNITLIGESVHGTIIKGNVLLKDSDSLIKNLTIRYDHGEEIPYGTDFKIVTDAGITAVNSAIAVDSCVIMPDPGIFGTDKQGKGIQIWTLSGSAAIAPVIKNNVILNTDAGVYLYSHETGGAITGEISNNTLDLNNYGITLRMYTENPAIHHNIITRSKDGIHEVYRDLISVRIGNITDNCFGAEAPSCVPADSFDNERDVWYDEVQREVIVALPWDTTGRGNIGVYPDFVGPYVPPILSYDYTPQNPNCDGMGARLPAL